MLFEVDRSDRLDRFLVSALPNHSRSKLSAHISAGRVFVDDRREKPSFIVEPGMIVHVDGLPRVAMPDIEPADIPLDIRYEDDDLLVVNKPRGLATHPAPSLREPSLVNALLGLQLSLSKTAGAFRPGIVHRLDKDTTGVLVVAKNDIAHANLARQIEARTAGRKYVAELIGALDVKEFVIDSPIGRDPANRLKMAVTPDGRPARTHVSQLVPVDGGTLVFVRLETGRTHQIRVHAAAIEHSVAGDPLYGTGEKTAMPMQLHAYEISFDHPTTGTRLSVTAEPPEDFRHRLLVP